jgi:hypothetical protein
LTPGPRSTDRFEGFGTLTGSPSHAGGYSAIADRDLLQQPFSAGNGNIIS